MDGRTDGWHTRTLNTLLMCIASDGCPCADTQVAFNITLYRWIHTHIYVHRHTSCVPCGAVTLTFAKTPCGQHRLSADEKTHTSPSYPLFRYTYNDSYSLMLFPFKNFSLSFLFSASTQRRIFLGFPATKVEYDQ